MVLFWVWLQFCFGSGLVPGQVPGGVIGQAAASGKVMFRANNNITPGEE